MTTTTHPEFNDRTEALEVARAFADGIRGKTVIVTGVNRSGIGFSTSEAFASQAPAHLILAGRTPSKLQESIDALRARFPDVDYRPLHIDLSSQRSVRAAAAELLSWPDVASVDILVNGAGVMGIQERTLSEDGIEMHFATNHVGHFLFTCCIMPKLVKAASSSEAGAKGATRVVNVTSGSPIMAKMRWSDCNFEKKTRELPESERPDAALLARWGYGDVDDKAYIPLEGYNQSKVANVLFGIAATRRLYVRFGILSVAVHPGVIKTELERGFAPETSAAVASMAEQGVFTYRSQGAGASTSLVAALDPGLKAPETRGGKENFGAFLMDCQISDLAQPLAVSSSEADRLWTLSEELVKEKFAW